MSAIDPQPGEAEALLKGLTPAQYRVMRAGGLTMKPGYWPLRAALIDKGLMTTANRELVLTPLGHALRALIWGAAL